jgi:hypothetical protein
LQNNVIFGNIIALHDGDFYKKRYF